MRGKGMKGMVDSMKLSGTITAMVTPFAKDGSVDYGRLKAIVDAQVAAGVEGICAVGTSGESPTLSHEEHHEVPASPRDEALFH